MGWKLEIIEVSNNVFKITYTHDSGATIVKTGTGVKAIKLSIQKDALKMEAELSSVAKVNKKPK